MDKEYLKSNFEKFFGCEPDFFESACGRVELLGNHTDHQGGKVLAASVNMTTDAAFRPNGTDRINIFSEGFPAIHVDLSDLPPKAEEMGTSIALVRGVAFGFAKMLAKKEKESRSEKTALSASKGINTAGFDAFISSEVLPGSGLSSSAAFEVLVGRILRQILGIPSDANGCQTIDYEEIADDIEIAKIGQMAENLYFGKPCGLMDQMACSLGNIVFIDFADSAQPKVEQLSFDFEEAGYALCIIDSGADHAGLTEDYASIPAEMKQVAAYFGKELLSEVESEKVVISEEPSPELISAVGLRPALRAFHYFQEVGRVEKAVDALKRNDIDTFLAQVNASGLSSRDVLQNMIPSMAPDNKKYYETYEFVRTLLDGRGAVRINGGGFAGTILAFVPLDFLNEFKEKTRAVLGDNSCHVMNIENPPAQP